MATTDDAQIPDMLADDTPWTVRRCSSGCLHLQAGCVCLTFTTPEFCRFVQVLGEAYVRLSVQDLVLHQDATH